MASIDPKRLTTKLSDVVRKTLEARQRAAIIACVELTALLKVRVFTKGLDADGKKIGSYSTKPFYASIQGTKDAYGSKVRSSSLKPRGKGESKSTEVFDIKSKKKKKLSITSEGNERRSMYLPRGYAELREVLGRQSKTVDLFLTGSLSGSIKTGTSAGFETVAFSNPDIAGKGRKLETKYKRDIFMASGQETELVEQIIEDQIEKAFFEAFDD